MEIKKITLSDVIIGGILFITGYGLGGLRIESSAQSFVSSLQLSDGARLFLYIIVFGIFAAIFYNSLLTFHRMGRSNIHYVGRDLAKRLDEQARGYDPPPIEKEENDVKKESTSKQETRPDTEVLHGLSQGNERHTPDYGDCRGIREVDVLMSYLSKPAQRDGDDAGNGG